MAKLDQESEYQAILIKEMMRKYGKEKGREKAIAQITNIGSTGVDNHSIKKILNYNKHTPKISAWHRRKSTV
ncbi:hypothetical protein M0R04_06100 [Candidatus Dojkabacteria bacterium]|jgi:hypothetical protein|nr:hypothetical protein [Candidatus Dojkabacteria bacterium]